METRARLVLTWNGEPTHELISDLLSTSPTRFWSEGDLIHPRAKKRRRTHGWELDSGADESADVPTHLNELARLVEPRASHIKQLISDWKVHGEVSVVVYFDPEFSPMPALYVEHDILAVFCDSRVNMDFDLIATAAD